MKIAVMSLLAATVFIGAIHMPHANNGEAYSNTVTNDRMLIVLSTPSVNDDYYQEDFESIVEFQKTYARTVLGNDNVIVLVDSSTKPYYADSLPEDILLEVEIEDIWIRDFSTVLPSSMQFTYDPTYFEFREDAEAIQESFICFSEEYDLEYEWNNYVLDGGNIVDNGSDKLVTTTRFLEENGLTKAEANVILRQQIGVSEVAIIPYDDEIMGHADGMVLWGDSNTLFVNTYEEPFRNTVLSELRESLTGVTVVEVPSTISYKRWRNFQSACGVNVNAVATYNHLYVPTFHQPAADAAAIETIQAHSSKKIHTIPAEHVCHMGGSVRCLSWQVTGENARKLIEAARID